MSDTRSGGQAMSVVDAVITGSLDAAMTKKIVVLLLLAAALLVSGGVVHKRRSQ